MGISLQGVSNLWIPVFLAALHKLRVGGAFAFVVPTEAFTGCSARVARDWLSRNVEALRFDLFSPGSFPDVLQEVAVVSGRRTLPSETGRVTFVEHGASIRRWEHVIDNQVRTWTRYRLLPRHLDAIESAAEAASAVALGNVATFEVSNVTGANDYFCVDDSEIQEWDLGSWAEAPSSAHPVFARVGLSGGGSQSDTAKGLEGMANRLWAGPRSETAPARAAIHLRRRTGGASPTLQVPHPQPVVRDPKTASGPAAALKAIASLSACGQQCRPRVYNRHHL